MWWRNIFEHNVYHITNWLPYFYGYIETRVKQFKCFEINQFVQFFSKLFRYLYYDNEIFGGILKKNENKSHIC